MPSQFHYTRRLLLRRPSRRGARGQTPRQVARRPDADWDSCLMTPAIRKSDLPSFSTSDRPKTLLSENTVRPHRARGLPCLKPLTSRCGARDSLGLAGWSLQGRREERKTPFWYHVSNRGRYRVHHHLANSLATILRSWIAQRSRAFFRRHDNAASHGKPATLWPNPRGRDTRPPRRRSTPCPVRPSDIQRDDAVVCSPRSPGVGHSLPISVRGNRPRQPPQLSVP